MVVASCLCEDGIKEPEVQWPSKEIHVTILTELLRHYAKVNVII